MRLPEKEGDLSTPHGALGTIFERSQKRHSKPFNSTRCIRNEVAVMFDEQVKLGLELAFNSTRCIRNFTSDPT